MRTSARIGTGRAALFLPGGLPKRPEEAGPERSVDRGWALAGVAAPPAGGGGRAHDPLDGTSRSQGLVGRGRSVRVILRAVNLRDQRDDFTPQALDQAPQGFEIAIAEGVLRVPDLTLHRVHNLGQASDRLVGLLTFPGGRHDALTAA